MASNQGRLFSSLIKRSAPKLVLSYARSESVTLSGPNSARRLICPSIQLQQEDQVNPKKLEEEESEIKEKIQNEKDNEDEDEDDDFDMNKETGEIGGPRGPEPTRYGDWERNGRCSDF
ncbi:succinate dehydrogenase assembly factor 4, mitochondrial-like [Camellia sinensis]|uniref:Succinate dehydrogenase assembly factor 4, mitochondrial n=1 Tax=Camellia sinensis var. sinensis TaxID=542762 RepID=A0A4S4DKE3_CAMSN|nr:succinate dehydrogenase assembly factor 4, mitochondrial-like [Camellia sinensis]THG03370.1 hypothetical protein TEA_010355 [Camellia sinensis var. sinensis]